MKKSSTNEEQDDPRRLVELWLDVHGSSLMTYATGLFNGASSIQGKGPDDIVLEIFDKLFSKSLIELQKIRKPKNYLCWSIRNAVSNARKRSKIHDTVTVEISARTQMSENVLNEAPFLIYKGECLKLLKKALTVDEFTVLDMFYSGYSYKEIGEILELSTSTVGMRISRARKKTLSILRENHLF
ncbi:MAG: sigma-70 family RNA polymerase sigma factor [Bacteroidota bacterium]